VRRIRQERDAESTEKGYCIRIGVHWRVGQSAHRRRICLYWERRELPPAPTSRCADGRWANADPLQCLMGCQSRQQTGLGSLGNSQIPLLKRISVHSIAVRKPMLLLILLMCNMMWNILNTSIAYQFFPGENGSLRHCTVLTEFTNICSTQLEQLMN